ncbi:hypothetical protein BDR22DRAFT_240933 [Usnea florida]
MPPSLPFRARTFQFLILPSNRSYGHGTHLYNAMVRTFRGSHTCTITVENPFKASDDLRDYCDYKYLLDNSTFAKISPKTDIDPKLTARKLVSGFRLSSSQTCHCWKPFMKNKIAPPQFARLVGLSLPTIIAPHNRQAGIARLTQRARVTDHY